jgi:ABC-type Mn2+/Zn2+ transport system ATPase subunit
LRTTLNIVETVPAVRVRGAVLSRGGQVALQVDELDIEAGTVTALVGPNGSGKSTLLHAIAGLLEPRPGTVEVLGTTPAEARRRVAYVLQAVAVTDHLPVTVGEVVAMGRYASLGVLGRRRAADRALVDAAIERLELGDLVRRHLGELSGGQRQRALVAQALAHDADLLLLDEPVTGLDLASMQRIRDVVAEERAAGRTVVVATHDLPEAQQADRVVLLAGRVVRSGTPAEAITKASLAEAYAGRLLQLDGETVLLDDGAHHDHDHGHGHDDHAGHPH